jgi:uncharacterized paraquat-inducible protein A
MSNPTMTTCSACGKSVSRNAAACPSCGQPINQPTVLQRLNRSPALIFGVIVLLLLIIFGPKAIAEYIMLHFFAPKGR